MRISDWSSDVCSSDLLLARTRAGEESVGRHQPVATRFGHLAGEDLDPVAALQLVVERHDPAVDLGAAAAMTHVGMHVIGEVQRRGAARQVDDLPARGQHVDAVRSEEHTSELQSLMRISYAVFCLKKKKKTMWIITIRSDDQTTQSSQ